MNKEYLENLKNKTRYSFYDLVDIMDILRSGDGCPWDREQTHESLEKCLLEEAYEVIDAIEKNNMEMLIDELGDVLLQVVFHARIAKENGVFGVDDITAKVCRKLISRHTHIFGGAYAKTAKDVIKNWEEVKREEKNHKTYTDELKDIPKSLPALARSYKVQKKAANIGFDWDKPSGALEKVIEEAKELLQVFDNGGDKKRIDEEAGDILFSLVNLLRMMDIEPETALIKTTDKFIKRFDYIESKAVSEGKDIKSLNMAYMDELWEEAKKKGL